MAGSYRYQPSTSAAAMGAGGPATLVAFAPAPLPPPLALHRSPCSPVTAALPKPFTRIRGSSSATAAVNGGGSSRWNGCFGAGASRRRDGLLSPSSSSGSSSSSSSSLGMAVPGLADGLADAASLAGGGAVLPFADFDLHSTVEAAAQAASHAAAAQNFNNLDNFLSGSSLHLSVAAASAIGQIPSSPSDAFLPLPDSLPDLSTMPGSVGDSIGEALTTIENAVHNGLVDPNELLTTEMEEMSLDAVGHDLLLFLAASVVVEPLGKILNVTPVLLYLLLGFIAGPNGLSLFMGGTEVDAEIGDFGILFLLFVEGLNLSPERLKALGSFFSLGATQLLLSVGVIFFGFFLGGPYLLPFVQDVRVPIDEKVFSLLENPVTAFCIAAAGALSSSAFVLPILKEKGWEKGADGIAALSILLLQDLAVAPLLVILPLIADYENGGGAAGGGGGGMMSDPSALTLLVAKATIGFGGVLAIASQALRYIFQIVASYGSSQTFVAASLLVACGMGIVADNLGLSATTGAFAAGVLLAESGYRAQIEADIKPFEGILLGVFFTTAGASLDPATVIEQWPTLLAGILAFIVVKIGIVFSAGSFALGLTRSQSARVALLLAGGGEFAFVVFKLAEDLEILNDSLTKLLTASVIISMSLTPLLGELAELLGNKLDEMESRAGGDGLPGLEDYDVNLTDEKRIREAFQTFDEDGNGAISAKELVGVLTKPGTVDETLSLEEVEAVIARFDDNGDGELQYDEFAALWTAKRRGAIEVLSDSDSSSSSSGEKGSDDVSNAIVICGYGEVGQRLCAELEYARKKVNGPAYVAFSRNPSRISTGVLNGATVVYGDGASSALVKAAGVEKPAAFAVTYVSESKCLEATKRLRDTFPDVPIYVRADRRARVKKLLEAGATDVIVEKDKVADSLGIMLGIKGRVTVKMLQDAVPTLMDDLSSSSDGGGGGTAADLLPYTDTELTELANQCGKTTEEMVDLFKLFATSFGRNDKGEVQLAELRNELMRQSDTPLDDETLADWMGYDEALSKWVTGDAEKQWVSFSDFVRFTADKREEDAKVER